MDPRMPPALFRKRYRSVPATAVLFVLTGCALGSGFERPPAPNAALAPPALSPATTSAETPGGDAQRFVMGGTVAGEWWRLFQSETLNALVAEALKENPDLEAAEASLRQAQEIYAAERSVLFPAIDANAGYMRQKTFAAFAGGQAVPNAPYSISTAGVSVTYSPDVFGAPKYVEAFRARAETARFQREAAYLALTSNLVAAAIQQAALTAQVAATQEILDAQTQQLDVLRRQLELGGIPEAQVLEQQAVVARTRALLPSLEKQLAQTRHLLLALAGRFPSEDAGTVLNLADLSLPQDVPVSLSSEFVAQRPDIRAAESILQAASAEVGVATASLFPRLTISGSYGSSGSEIGDLFSAGSTVWSIGANVLQPIFRGGELLHRKRAAVAAYDAAAAQYRAVVLSAFRDVADVLRALELDAAALAAQAEAERAASENLEIARLQLETGGASFLSFLNAQNNYQQARIALVQARANRFADTAALFVALGGGWWNRGSQAMAAGQPAVSE